MIVADASAMAELLLARPRAAVVRTALSSQPELHVPEHFHVEVLSVLRRYAIRGELSGRRAAEALAALSDLRALTYPALELADAVWDLRDELTAYAAAYLALARRLDVGLVTLDKGLAGAATRDGRLVAPLGDSSPVVRSGCSCPTNANLLPGTSSQSRKVHLGKVGFDIRLYI